MSLSDIPKDVIRHLIFDFLDFKTKISFRQTCKTFYEFQITQIPSEFLKFVDDETLKLFPFLESIKLLETSKIKCKITSEGLKSVSRLKKLSIMPTSKVVFPGLSHFPFLEVLCLLGNVSGSQINITLEESLSCSNQISALDISGNKNVTDKCLKFFTHLDCFFANDCPKITSEGLKCLPNLTYLDIGGRSGVREEGLLHTPLVTKLTVSGNLNITSKAFQYVPRLEKLTAWGNSPAVVTSESLEKLPFLVSLCVTLNRGIEFDTLKSAPNLTYLNASGSSIVSEELKYVPKLKTLYAIGKDTRILSLENVPNLTHLDASGSNIESEELRHVPALKILRVAGEHTKISSEGLKYTPLLETLKFKGNTKITKEGAENAGFVILSEENGFKLRKKQPEKTEIV